MWCVARVTCLVSLKPVKDRIKIESANVENETKKDRDEH